jgi:hypothetical protein
MNLADGIKKALDSRRSLRATPVIKETSALCQRSLERGPKSHTRRTGLKTAEGKVAAARNARRHGATGGERYGLTCDHP